MADGDVLNIASGHQAFSSLNTAGIVPATSHATFDQSANSVTTTAVPAAVNAGVLVLLTEVIAAVGTLQTAINTNQKLINEIIDVLQAAGLAS